ncbi:Ig-like domain-containing protein, partial [Pseudomonas sp. PDM33]|uniref:Ig-like domain-containing protein n=1 Tax=Pseudomonas sp. PDM33 TaxID=2854765 RepID=UPI001C4526F2
SFDATDSHSYTLSIVPLAATLTIDWVAGDNIVNVDESKSPDNTVTGTSSGARAGDVVTLTINGKAYSGTVAADGKSWSVSGIAGSDLVADSDLKVDGKLHATDAAGNSFDATDSHS